MKLTKTKIISVSVIILLLVTAWFLSGNKAGGDTPEDIANVASTTTTTKNTNTETKNEENRIQAEKDAGDENDENKDENKAEESSENRSNIKNEENNKKNEAPTTATSTSPTKTSTKDTGDTEDNTKKQIINPETGKDKYLTDPVPEGKPLPVEPQDVTIGNKSYTCTLEVRCDTILNNIDDLDPEKIELVPENGIIFPTTTVPFYEGESVFNVLQREMKKAGIHMEFVNTPIYNSAYIEGINNLYEFDCGELSGWMYKVNGWFPNYGCSRYQLQQGDVIIWDYTCDLGRDVGGYYSVGGGS